MKLLPGLAVGLGVSVAANGRISHRTSSSSSSSSIISSSASPPHTSTVLPSPSPSPSPTPTNTVCMTESCVTLAALVLDNMDRSIDPCDDFYNFTCGGWEATNIVPEGLCIIIPTQTHLVLIKREAVSKTINTIFNVCLRKGCDCVTK